MIDRHTREAPTRPSASRCAALCLSVIVLGSSCSNDAGMRGDSSDPAPPAKHGSAGSTGGAPPLGADNAPVEVQPIAGAPGEAQVGGAKPGTFVPSAMLDPNASFDWPEAVDGSKCDAGTYTGTFDCTFMFDQATADAYGISSSDIPPITGPITLTFEKSADGEFLELTNAQLNGVAQDFIGFDAQLSGRLDCATMQLTATITSGEFGFGSPVLFQFGEIAGDLNGALDGQTGLLSGRWNIGVGPADMMFGACEGPWMANFTP